MEEDMPKKSQTKKKVEKKVVKESQKPAVEEPITEETPVVEEPITEEIPVVEEQYEREAEELLVLERSMYDRHPEMFERKEEPLVRGVISYPISYIRSEPKQKSKILRILYRDAPLELLSGDEGGWTKIQTVEEPITQGYTKTAFIQKSER